MELTEEQKSAIREWKKLSPEQREQLLVLDRGRKVQELPFGAEGFSHFFWCGMKKELPPYAREIWVPALVDAKNNGSGVILEGFRGASKSTMIFWWVLYVEGKRPVGSSVIARINDEAAAETGKAMAETIEKSLAWKACFPNVVPDKERGWSSNGWFLKDTNVEYGKWVQETITDHLGEPSILCAGITSGVHIGKHPSNGWYADDFHDEQNTRSTREMQSIVDTLEKNIIPTWSRPEGHPTLAIACTFWDDNDGYHSMLKTGLFKHIRTPIYTIDPNGIEYPGISHRGEKIKLAWPEAYTLDKVVEIERRNPVWFPVMYLCDLNALKGTVLKREWLHRYPSDKIDPSWPVYFGVDFASSDDKLREKERDYFALAVGAAIPGGGVVLIDGIRGRWPAAESMAHLKSFAAKYPTLVSIGIEKWGKGETFKDMLIYSTDLPVVPCPFQGYVVKSKGQRYQAEGGLAPMFVDGRMWISDNPHSIDFVSAFEEEWVSWDGEKTRTGHDDCLDGVYWMAYMAQSHLQPKSESLGIGVKKQPRRSVWAALGAGR